MSSTPKLTKTTRVALERLADQLGFEISPGVVLKKGSTLFTARSTKRALATLADLAMRAENKQGIKEAVNWQPGFVPDRGLSAWEYQSLMWLKSDGG